MPNISGRTFGLLGVLVALIAAMLSGCDKRPWEPTKSDLAFITASDGEDLMEMSIPSCVSPDDAQMVFTYLRTLSGELGGDPYRLEESNGRICITNHPGNEHWKIIIPRRIWMVLTEDQ